MWPFLREAHLPGHPPSATSLATALGRVPYLCWEPRVALAVLQAPGTGWHKVSGWTKQQRDAWSLSQQVPVVGSGRS